MGVVYELEGPGCDDLAVKLVHPGLDCPQAALAQLAWEAHLEMHLQGMDSVVQTLECQCISAVQAYKIMRKIKGRPIYAPFDSALMNAVLSAVTAVHQRGVVHGDLKPSNIMLSEQGDIILIDFGLGRLLSSLLKSGRVSAYTPRYASPRVLSGFIPEVEDDLYSIKRIFEV